MKDFPSKEHFWLHVLANFLGGGLITGGSGEYRYDGFDILPNFKIWKCLLTDVCNSISDQTSPEAKNLLNILNGISLLEECAEELDRLTQGRIADGEIVSLAKTKGQKISELVPGQSLLMVGGWSNTGGKAAHAMIYEFVRREDQLFDIYLYSGTETALTEIFLIGDKRRVKPVVLYEAVPEHVLLQNRDGVLRPAVIQSLIELNALKAADPNSDVDQKDVRIIFSLLEKYKVTVPLSQFGAITGQRGGTCLPSVTKATIRRHAHHLGLYKQKMFPCMLRLMAEGYQATKEKLFEDSEAGSELRRCFQSTARNIMRRAAKLQDEESSLGVLITPEQGLQATATGCHLLQIIEEAEKQVAYPGKRLSQAVI